MGHEHDLGAEDLEVDLGGPSSAEKPLRKPLRASYPRPSAICSTRFSAPRGSWTIPERATLHVHDDTGRICLIETKTAEDDEPIVDPANIARYQYSNHLGTAALELDDAVWVLSCPRLTRSAAPVTAP